MEQHPNSDSNFILKVKSLAQLGFSNNFNKTQNQSLKPKL